MFNLYAAQFVLALSIELVSFQLNRTVSRDIYCVLAGWLTQLLVDVFPFVRHAAFACKIHSRAVKSDLDNTSLSVQLIQAVKVLTNCELDP